MGTSPFFIVESGYFHPTKGQKPPRRRNMASKTRITPCLWFDGQALEAAKYYVKIFKNSKIRKIARYGEAGREQHGQKPGSVLIVEFELDGRPFTALNGGPIFKFNEAVSMQVRCKDQKEVDYYWKKLTRRRRSRCPGLRLAQGQVRPVLADRAGPRHQAHQRPQVREIAARIRGDDEAEEARHRGGAKSLRRLISFAHYQPFGAFPCICAVRRWRRWQVRLR